MHLFELVAATIGQLDEVLTQLNDEQYVQPCTVLNGGTVGQHARHIIELFQCLERGYLTGEVCYDRRDRDKAIETSKVLASTLLQGISHNINRPNINLEVAAEVFTTDGEPLQSNYLRELAYNLEHTIHHLALLRPALAEIADLRVGDAFGVAPSTLKYREQCAQ
ncbi:MAG: DinB family protein [Chitinophagia bacterium]|nr:DinB family protein [Chitinophagia bacterium]